MADLSNSAPTNPLLQDMKDITLPAEPGWFPPAPGWWVIGLLLILTIAYVVWRRQRQHGALKKSALSEWQQLQTLNQRSQLMAMRALIRRIAKQHYNLPVGSDDKQWQQWLQSHSLEAFFITGDEIWSATHQADPQQNTHLYQQLGQWIRGNL